MNISFQLYDVDSEEKNKKIIEQRFKYSKKFLAYFTARTLEEISDRARENGFTVLDDLACLVSGLPTEITEEGDVYDANEYLAAELGCLKGFWAKKKTENMQFLAAWLEDIHEEYIDSGFDKNENG